jgi:hypothetical protein
MRTMLVRHQTMNLATGAIITVTEGKSEWRTEPCGVPLFGDEAKRLGVCASCREGWTDPENRPATPSEIAAKGGGA